MIKEMKVCECDVCGRIKKPTIYIDYNSSEQFGLPAGWSNLGNTGISLCDICNKAFRELWKKYQKEEENV